MKNVSGEIILSLNSFLCLGNELFPSKLQINVLMSCQQKLNIEKWNSCVDGELSSKNMEKKLRTQSYSYVKYCFQPGTDFPDHAHEVSKKDAIISGHFQFSMYGQTVVLEPGDIVEVPKHTIHNARVVGSENVTFYDSTK